MVDYITFNPAGERQGLIKSEMKFTNFIKKDLGIDSYVIDDSYTKITVSFSLKCKELDNPIQHYYFSHEAGNLPIYEVTFFTPNLGEEDFFQKIETEYCSKEISVKVRHDNGSAEWLISIPQESGLNISESYHMLKQTATSIQRKINSQFWKTFNIESLSEAACFNLSKYEPYIVYSGNTLTGARLFVSGQEYEEAIIDVFSKSRISIEIFAPFYFFGPDDEETEYRRYYDFEISDSSLSIYKRKKEDERNIVDGIVGGGTYIPNLGLCNVWVEDQILEAVGSVIDNLIVSKDADGITRVFFERNGAQSPYEYTASIETADGMKAIVHDLQTQMTDRYLVKTGKRINIFYIALFIAITLLGEMEGEYEV